MSEQPAPTNRDQHLLNLAAEVLRVYWGQPAEADGLMLRLQLPVLDSEAEIEISVKAGVFCLCSRLPLPCPCPTDQLNSVNSQMPAVAYHYVAHNNPDGQGEVWLQTKLAVPDLDWEAVRPPVLALAFQAGYRAAQRSDQPSPSWSGPSSYDHFVYLADFLAKAIQEQWLAQQEAHSLALRDLQADSE